MFVNYKTTSNIKKAFKSGAATLYHSIVTSQMSKFYMHTYIYMHGTYTVYQ